MIRHQDRGDRKARATRPFKRRLQIRDQEWSYRIGRWKVALRSPDGKTYTATLGQVAGNVSDDEIERRLHKGGWQGIGPGDLKRYVQETFLGLGPREVRTYIEKEILGYRELTDSDRQRAKQWLANSVELAIKACVLAYPSLNESRIDVLHQWFCVLGSGVEWTDEGVLDVSERGDDRILRAALEVGAGANPTIRPASNRDDGAGSGWYPMSDNMDFCAPNLLRIPKNAKRYWVLAAQEIAKAIVESPRPAGRERKDHDNNVRIANKALDKIRQEHDV